MNFQNLLYSISENLKLVKLTSEQTLFRINDIGDYFYIILKGRVMVLKPVKRQNMMTCKEFYNYLLKFIDQNEHYLFKLNLKANSDLFFSCVEDFEIYEKTLKKIKVNEIIFTSNFSSEETIEKIYDELDRKEENLVYFKLTLSELESMKKIDKENFLWKIRKIFETSLEENETFTKYNQMINSMIDKKQFFTYEYESFIELRTKQFFGDFALDAVDRRRTATIRACEETYLACISFEIYNKYIQAEKIKYRNKDISLLNNYIIFKHIKQIHFEKNYFQDFAPFEFEKDYILFKQGEILNKLFIIKSGSIDFYLNANLVDINLLIKNLILKAKECNIFNSQKANELLDKFYDGLNVRNKSTPYFENLLRKKNFLLFSSSKGEAPGIESIFLNIPCLYKGIIKSDKCKFFKFDLEKFNNLLKSYDTCNQEYYDLIEKKLQVILARLFNIKNCLVGRYSIDYDMQTKFEKMKIESQDNEGGGFDEEYQEKIEPETNKTKILQKPLDSKDKIFSLTNHQNEEYHIIQNENPFSNEENMINNISYKDFKNAVKSRKNKKNSIQKLKINYQEFSTSQYNQKISMRSEEMKSNLPIDSFNISKNESFGRTNGGSKVFKDELHLSNQKNTKNLFLESADNNKNSKKNNTIIMGSEDGMLSAKKHKKREDMRKMSILQFPILKNKMPNEENKRNNIEREKLLKTNITNINEILEFSHSEEFNQYENPKPCKLNEEFNNKELNKKFIVTRNTFLSNEKKKLKIPTEYSTNVNFFKKDLTIPNNLSDVLENINKENRSISCSNFMVAVKNFNEENDRVNNNYFQKDYFKNMKNFKVRNDINLLINSKNQKETLKTLMSFSVSNSNVNKITNRISDLNEKYDFNKTIRKSLLFSSSNFFDSNGKKIGDIENHFPNSALKSTNNKKSIRSSIFQASNKCESKTTVGHFPDQKLEEHNTFLSKLNQININNILLSKNYNVKNQKKNRGNLLRDSISYDNLNESMPGINNSQDITNDINKLDNSRKIMSKIITSPMKILNSNFSRTNNFFNRNKNTFYNTIKESHQDNSIYKSNNHFHQIRRKDEKICKISRDVNLNNEKQSCFNSTSNGFSVSDKNFRTTLESYLPKKTIVIQVEGESQVTYPNIKNESNEETTNLVIETDDNLKKFTRNFRKSELKKKDNDEEKKNENFYSGMNIIVSEQYKTEEQSETAENENDKNKFNTKINQDSDFDHVSIAQQTNENINEENENNVLIKESTEKDKFRNFIFNVNEFTKNKIHYKNYNDEIQLPTNNLVEKNLVKRIKEFRSQVKVKLRNKSQKKK